MNAESFLPALRALDEEIARLTQARHVLAGLLPREVESGRSGSPVEAPVPPARPVDPITPGAPRAPRTAPRKVRVLAMLPEEGGAKVKDIASHLGEPNGYVHADIEAMTQKGHAERVARGTYIRTRAGSAALEVVWSGAMKRPLIDREDATQALSGREVQL